MINVMVVDDHSIVREGVKKIIGFETDMQLISEAKSAEDALDMLSISTVDVLILDINLPGKSGLDLLKDLRAIHPDVKILMLTMHPEDHLAIRTLKAGASGYLTKEAVPDLLVKAIRKISSGGRYISPELAEHLALELQQQSTGSPHELLSDREFEVMLLLAKGLTIAEVATKLSISDRTVSTYRARILEKMSLATTAEIIHYAVRSGLVD